VAVVVVEVEVVDVVVVDVVEVDVVEVVDVLIVDVELVVKVDVVGTVLVLVIAVEVSSIVDAFVTAISDVKAVVTVTVLLSDGASVDSTPASAVVVCFAELSVFPLLCSSYYNYFLTGKHVFNLLQLLLPISSRLSVDGALFL
jgi:hypothetical protein